ncbi:putative Pol protein, partial [Daphnia magna]
IHPLNLPISITELNISINGLPNKAMGRDKVHNEMITKLDKENRCTLLELLNISYSSGYLPPEWKNAIVVPIPKPNKPPNLPDSYRPISLTSCLCKVLERIMNNRLKWYAEKNRLLPKFQTGFRNGCTTTDNLIRLESAINNGFNENKSTTAVFLDIEKAYDSTWITGLIYKITKS